MGSCSAKCFRHRRGHDGAYRETREYQLWLHRQAQERIKIAKESNTTEKGGITRETFIIDHKKPIEDMYEIEKLKLGEGSFARVCKCLNKSTGGARAVKMLSKHGLSPQIEAITREISFLKELDHPNIVRMFETFEDQKHVYIVMEYCGGGEVFDKILEVSKFTESQAANLMKQIFKAVFYMHHRQVVHRDLKIENFCLIRDGPLEDNAVKVIDFGLARQFEPGETMSTKVGAPYFIAPQVLLGRYTEACDMWTLGVVMFIMLCGYPPFFGESDAEVLARVRVGNFQFNAGDWKHISAHAKDLIRGLLKLSEKDRFTAENALHDQWLRNKAPQRWEPIKLRYIDNLRAWSKMNELKRAAIFMISGQLEDEYTKPHVEMFMMLDESGEGNLNGDEIKEGMIKAGMVAEIPADLIEVCNQVDADGSGEIDYSEFLAATLDPRVYCREEPCWAAFRVFDAGGDGLIGDKELSFALSHGVPTEKWSREACRAYIKDVDEDGDKQVNFAEFMHMMQDTTDLQRFAKKKKKKLNKQDAVKEEFGALLPQGVSAVAPEPADAIPSPDPKAG